MDTNLITSAFLNVEQDYFMELKSEIDFLLCGFFHKSIKSYRLKYSYSCSKEIPKDTLTTDKPNGFYTLKIPVKILGNTMGYFLLLRKEKFKKEEKQKLDTISKKYSNRIKDYEISKIFQNQLLILQDAILQKNEATKKLKEQNEKLIETDKIRTEFLSNISHELRTPLNSIIGFSSAMKEGLTGKLNDKQQNFINKILASSIHLTGLINDILDMTKIESKAMKLNLKETDINQTIKETINVIEPLGYEKGIKIETNLKLKDNILTDEQKFRQIMFNLLGNAIKFSHKNSKVVVSTSKLKDCAIIKVKDFGIGIDKKDHKKIFEKFVQLDNIYTKTCSSTGLGLTITNELVKMQNGTISLKSSLNKGAEFTIKFKLKPQT